MARCVTTGEARLVSLARLAKGKPASEAALYAKARALLALIEAGHASPLSDRIIRRELRAVAEVEAVTSRGCDGVLLAVDGLDGLDGKPLEQVTDGSEEDGQVAERWRVLDDRDDPEHVRRYRPMR